ncbi:MAG: 16S rRNA (guanine(966)-N(2))-methyltransferase RsmD [Alicyclobacillus sp.]|nr:16S rRNA (guanine(966)-N(2))-methyltransferase RsmD [Alicyclobacillus sp.]
MRVIAGEWRGLHLAGPVGREARPTTDRVKESMFNLMGPRWSGGGAVDLFAGSGALGIEALSRGSDWAVFVDQSPRSMRLVAENLRRCRGTDRAETVVADWRVGWQRALRAARDRSSWIGWVFVDPPYARGLWPDVLAAIAQAELAAVHGVVCEHPRTVELPAEIGPLAQWKTRSYGDISLTLYHDARASAEGDVDDETRGVSRQL